MSAPPARELHDFLAEASDKHRFPLNYAQLERNDDDMVREAPALHLASSR